MRPATEMCDTWFSRVLQQSTAESAEPVSFSMALLTKTPWVHATETD